MHCTPHWPPHCPGGRWNHQLFKGERGETGVVIIPFFMSDIFVFFSWRLCFAVHSLLAEQTVQPPIEDKMSRTIPNKGTRGASQGVATCCHTVTAELNLWGQRGQPHWIMLGWHQHKTSPFSQRSQKHLFCWNPRIQKKFVLLKSYKSYNPIICYFVRNIYKYIVSKFGIAKLSLTM